MSEQQPASVGVRFSAPESELLSKVIKDVRGPNHVVVPMGALLQKVKQSVQQEMPFSLSDLGMLTNLVAKYQNYTVDDGLVLPALGQSLAKIVSALEQLTPKAPITGDKTDGKEKTPTAGSKPAAKSRRKPAARKSGTAGK